MKPEEIQPDTGLCTIVGNNAQTGYMRKYFNKIMKLNGKNATAIALNIKDEHFAITMQSVGQSKVTQMMIEREFSKQAMQYCESVDDCARREERVDFIEVKEGNVFGYCLEDKARALFANEAYLDDQIVFVAKVMLLAHRWFDTKIDVDDIPLLIK